MVKRQSNPLSDGSRVGRHFRIERIYDTCLGVISAKSNTTKEDLSNDAIAYFLKHEHADTLEAIQAIN